MVPVERLKCRLCDGGLHPVFSLKPAPIANSYPEKPDSGAERFPLELMACECGHVQQRYVFNTLFEDYKYQTPQTVARYLEPLAKRIADEYPYARVLEIGCNNGVFLEVMRRHGLAVHGVDPAAENTDESSRAYFHDGSADRWGKFDVVVGNNVFAHIDDLASVFRGVSRILEPDGAVIFEVQYLPALIASGSFDMIYHEHLDYHTLGPLKPFLHKFGLVMVGVEYIPTHGGSIRVTAKKFGEECDIPDENLDWDGLRERIEGARKRVKAEGDMVAFGAAAKASTLIGELGVADQIKFCVDDTPTKQFRYIPGTDIQILPVSALGDQKVLLTAWNYEREIAERIPNKLVHPFKS